VNPILKVEEEKPFTPADDGGERELAPTPLPRDSNRDQTLAPSTLVVAEEVPPIENEEMPLPENNIPVAARASLE